MEYIRDGVTEEWMVTPDGILRYNNKPGGSRTTTTIKTNPNNHPKFPGLKDPSY